MRSLCKTVLLLLFLAISAEITQFSGEKTAAAIVLPGIGLFVLLLVFGLSGAFVLP